MKQTREYVDKVERCLADAQKTSGEERQALLDMARVYATLAQAAATDENTAVLAEVRDDLAALSRMVKLHQELNG